MLKWEKFLESASKMRRLDLLKASSEKVIIHLNLVNDILMRYDEEFGIDYYFKSRVILLDSEFRSFITGRSEFFISNEGGEIVIGDKINLDRLDSVEIDRSTSLLMNNNLMTSYGTKRFIEIIYYVGLIGHIGETNRSPQLIQRKLSLTKAIKEISSRYPFLRIDTNSSSGETEFRLEKNEID